MKKTKNCINNQININTSRNSSVTVKDLTDGITLIALVITIIVSYDKMKKYSNINSFLFSKN